VLLSVAAASPATVPTAEPGPAAEAAAHAAPPDGVRAAIARVDALWGERDAPGRLDEIRADLAAAERKAPDDYDVLWRLARLDFWMADDSTLPTAERVRLGKLAWEYGDRAAARNPNGVEGWYFAAVGVGTYSLGIGVLKALAQGLEGKFRERLEKAERLDPRFYAGAVYNVWGRFYFKLPWPKYDPRKSERMFIQALTVNPENVRGRLYLAELYSKERHPGEARKLLEQAVAHRPGAYDGPEERRAQARARRLLAELK